MASTAFKITCSRQPNPARAPSVVPLVTPRRSPATPRDSRCRDDTYGVRSRAVMRSAARRPESNTIGTPTPGWVPEPTNTTNMKVDTRENEGVITIPKKKTSS